MNHLHPCTQDADGKVHSRERFGLLVKEQRMKGQVKIVGPGKLVVKCFFRLELKSSELLLRWNER